MADIKNLKHTRGTIKANLTRLNTYFTQNTETDTFDCHTRLEKLEELCKAFDKIQLEIELALPTAPIAEGDDDASAVIEENERMEFENNYYKCSKLIKKRLQEIGTESTSAQVNTNTTHSISASRSELCLTPTQQNIVYHVNHGLEKLEVRPYDGNPREWPSFKDAFVNLIDKNESMPTTEKFYRLKQALRGDLKDIIEDLDASDENYKVAWDLITQRCDKPRKITQSHLKQLLELPAIQKSSPLKIRALKEKAQMHVNALKALKEPVDSWDSILVFLVSSKLDWFTRKAWEETLEDNATPKFAELIKFLKKKERGESDFDTSTNQSNHVPNNQTGRKPKANINSSQSLVSTQNADVCTFCKEEHKVYSCPQLLKLDPYERSKAVRDKKLCLNCFRDNHYTKQCRASGCKICSKKHNTLLHFTHNANQNQSIQNQSSMAQSEVKNVLTVTHDAEVLLGTAVVNILDKFNKSHTCRLLLDGGSQSNFITEKLAKKLQLNQEKVDLPFGGLGQHITHASYKVKTKIQSRVNAFEHEIDLVALPIITGSLPSSFVDKSSLKLPSNIKLADPEFNKSAGIDILVGATLYYKLLSTGQIVLQDQPNVTLQKTLLGWIVAGEVAVKQSALRPRSCHLVSLDTKITQFWEIETIPQKKLLSVDEQKCEKYYAETTTRDSDGAYVVRLPFNDLKQKLGDTYRIALNRAYGQERKLSKIPTLKETYTGELCKYRDLGHLREITNINKRDEGSYIPHLDVLKENSAFTSLRIVFDASAKSSTSLSLNDTLLVGPTIQDELLSLVMRFRTHNVVLAGDIQKMFRCIKVHEDDVNYQKILWRNGNSEEMRVFALTTVTQGTASAPFLAARTLHQLANDEGGRYPQAAECLKNDFYVDDLLTGTSTIEAALELKNQLTKLLKLGGFTFHKWASNEPILRSNANLDKKLANENEQNSSLLDAQLKKLLGIHWNAETDKINYLIKPSLIENSITKRGILSQIAELFDPLGLLGPVIVVAKLIMQELWKIGVEWDETIPQVLSNSWLNLKNELELIKSFKVPRQIILPNAVNLQLHGFADASEQAYGAAVYLRSVDKDNKCFVQLICAKSRIAPIKKTTIPRLELCAALLLAQLIQKVIDSLKLTYDNVYLWSDSTITLHWLNTSPHLLKTFVANRVSEIQTLTENFKWQHIDTDENPADFISRGQTPSEFITNKLWLRGPKWLSKNEQDWKALQLSQVEIPERKVITSLVAATLLETKQIKNEILERFSTLNSLIKFIAFCRRAVNNSKLASKITGNYSTEELQNAHARLIKIVQSTHYPREIKNLQEGSNINVKSEIANLSPFLDEYGIMRVGGRINNSALIYSKKYPILLPRDNHVTKLIIENIHINYWHAGIQFTLNMVRQKYWPINGKATIRNVISKCIRCCKLNPKIPNYLMGDLPKSRVEQTRPFENVGIDYCGPFSIKEKKFRNTKTVKAYVAVFVCFVTKAVHLELVTDLTTECCLESIKRFTSRRGKPKNIYSDNATCFVGAKNELLKIRAFMLSEENNNSFSRSLVTEGISWHFSPPRSPHFGGLWEAAVKSFKKHLYRAVGETLFTYEQFNTCIIEIESILNSRPLTPISTDPNDLIALTPAHFLIGDSLASIPEHDYQDVPNNRLSLWQHIQKVKQHFWSRWHKEYLNELRTRSKWHSTTDPQVKIGTLVTIKEDDLPPMKWSLGRIIAVHPGDDAVIRVATVKTSTGTYKRCIKRLAPLPIDVE